MTLILTLKPPWRGVIVVHKHTLIFQKENVRPTENENEAVAMEKYEDDEDEDENEVIMEEAEDFLVCNLYMYSQNTK